MLSTMSNLQDFDPVALVGSSQTRCEAYRCRSCHAIEEHPYALSTFGATCRACGATISSRDMFFYAGLPRRLFAALVDFVAFSLPTSFVDLFIAGWEVQYAPKDWKGDPTHAAVIWITVTLVAFTLAVLLAYLLIGNARGRSPGKMLASVRIVVQETGKAPGLANSAVRTSAQMLTLLTLGAGYLMARFDKQRRTLHDRIAHTIVIDR
jgi:uncharacterized RDD family membrane protein YckC